MSKAVGMKFELAESEKKRIETLFNEGNGSAKISALLKIPEGSVRRFLKSRGLVRSKKQAYMEMKKWGL